ncbi:uncharacterized protein LOC116248891 [Nymphaea colorata]|nr:uncharacterized protein LOC116248891 [Nymphaea colorata]
MGNEMGNTNVSSMKVEEGKAEAHFQDNLSDNSLTDPVKKQIIVEDCIPPAGAEEIEEKQVISTVQDHPNAGDQLKHQLSHARDESLTTINESCDATIHHLLVEEKEARQVAGSVSMESGGSKAEHESITVLPEAIIIDGAEMPLSSSLEDKGVIYLNLEEAKCEKNVDHEKETIDTDDHPEREMISSPYVDIDAKDIKSLNQMGAQTSSIHQVDENIFQEKQGTAKSCDHEENIRSPSTQSESNEPEIVTCEPLVHLEDRKAKTLSKSNELPESSSQHSGDIKIEKHIQNMVLKIVEDRHGAELRECKHQSSPAHELHIEETGQGTSVNEDGLPQTDVPAVDTTAHEGKKEISEPMIVFLMLNEMTEPTLEDANATYFTPRSQSQPLEFLSDTEVDKPEEEFCGMSSSTVGIVPPSLIVCEIKKENGTTDGLEGNFSNVDPFSEKETGQIEVALQMRGDKTEMFSRDQDDKPEKERKEVVPPTPTISENKIEKENVDSCTDKQRDNSEKVNQTKDGDMKGDQLASESTVKHDRKKFLIIEDESEMEVSSPTEGAVNNGSETIKDDVLIEQAETTEAIKLKDEAVEMKSVSDLFGQPDHHNENSDATACTLDKCPHAETASVDIDKSRNGDSAKVSASEGSESGKLRSPLKIFFKTGTASRSIKEESQETSNTGDSLSCHLKEMSLPSSEGRAKQKTRSIFSSCMCCTAVIR